MSRTADRRAHRRRQRSPNDAERMLATLMGNLPGMVYRCRNDPGWTMEFLSEGCRALTGYRPEDFAAGGGVAYAELIHPEDRDRVWDEVQRAVAVHRPFQIEYRLRTATGSERWVWEHGCGIFDEQGALQFLEGYIADVTDRVTAERELRATRTRLRHLLDSSPAVTYATSYTPDHTCTFVSDNLREVTGYAPTEMIGSSRFWLDRVHPEDRERVLAELAHNLAGGGGASEYRFRHADGHYGWILDRYRVVYEAERPVEVVGSWTDITASRQADEKLRASEERFRVLYDENPSMYFTVHPSGRILSVNTFGAAQLGYHRAELAGMALQELVAPEDRPALTSMLNAALLTPHQRHHLELRMHRKHDRGIWVRFNARGVLSEDREPQLLIVCEDITEAHQLSEQLTYQARHDPLTGLANRLEFERALERLIDSAREQHVEHALCYLDLDQFKIVNDTCGHLAGDELLRQVSETLRARVRRGDVLARLGGDEFAILFENCALTQARRVIDSLHTALRDFRFQWEGKRFSVGASMGLVSITDLSGSVQTVMTQADTACYTAKDLGRNRVCVYHEADADLARRHGEMRWVTRINEALEKDTFRLLQQTIAPVHGAPQGLHFEILLRLADDSGDPACPHAFMPAAERFGLSPQIDRFVIEQTFRWLGAHPSVLEALYLCAINLSGASIGDTDLPAFLDQMFDRWRIPHERICFEITETAAIASLNSAVRLIEGLRERGCSFALDDFGSGLSSFGYLKNLPVDFLKIDGRFVRNIAHDPIERAMVRSINEIGHVMGKKTIAEFVESDAILACLGEIRVDYAQGYAISAPAPLATLVA